MVFAQATRRRTKKKLPNKSRKSFLFGSPLNRPSHKSLLVKFACPMATSWGCSFLYTVHWCYCSAINSSNLGHPLHFQHHQKWTLGNHLLTPSHTMDGVCQRAVFCGRIVYWVNGRQAILVICRSVLCILLWHMEILSIGLLFRLHSVQFGQTAER